MATPFSDIYERALYRFSDTDFLKYTDTLKESTMRHFLYSAQSDFEIICTQDLSDKDETLKQYNVTLDNDSVEILALGIAYYWVSAKTLNNQLMRNSLKTSEYAFFSPEALLSTIINLRDTIGSEFRAKMIQYSYDHNDVSSLKV